MKKNRIRINIDRAKYGLSPTKSTYGNVLLAEIIKQHRDKISVRAFDLFGSGTMKYITIDKKEVLSRI